MTVAFEDTNAFELHPADSPCITATTFRYFGGALLAAGSAAPVVRLTTALRAACVHAKLRYDEASGEFLSGRHTAAAVQELLAVLRDERLYRRRPPFLRPDVHETRAS